MKCDYCGEEIKDGVCYEIETPTGEKYLHAFPSLYACAMLYLETFCSREVN